MHPIKIVIETDGRANVHAQSDYEGPLTIEGCMSSCSGSAW